MSALRRLWRYLCNTPVVDAIDPSPEYLASVERAKADQIEERRRYGVDEDGKVRRQHGLSQIIAAHQQSNVIYLAERRRQLANRLTDECGQVTGPAFTFERREK